MNSSRQMRVMWVNSFCLLDTSSGASMSVMQMMTALKGKGIEIDIVGATIFDAPAGNILLKEKWNEIIENKDKIINISHNGITHHLAITGSTKRSEMTVEEVTTWHGIYLGRLEVFKPDLVMFYGGTPIDMLIADEARSRGIPSTAYLVNENYAGARWCRDVDLIITDTAATASFYHEKEGYKIVPVGKFIDRNKITSKNKIRKNVLFINPSPQKGAAIVAMIALLMEKQRPEIKFEVVQSRGDWVDVVSEVTRAHEEVKRDKLNNVILTSHTSDMKAIYARARIILAPSLWRESGARVLAEAMINGIPAIVSDRGGNSEMIKNGGVVVALPTICYEPGYNKVPPINSLQPIVDLIIKWYDDEDNYNLYVNRAEAVGRYQHDIEVSTQRLVDCISPLLAKKAGDFNHYEMMKLQHKNGLKDSIELRLENNNYLDEILFRNLNPIVGSIPWLIKKESAFGGVHSGVIRRKTSSLDKRSPSQYSAGYVEIDGQKFPVHTGGDRMSFNHHGYSLAYSIYIKKFLEESIGKNLTIVEVGILKGVGLAIWCDLFPNARVIGLDLDLSNYRKNVIDLKKRGAFTKNQPEVYEFDQFADNENLVEEILNGGEIDIVIDDGAHTFEAITCTYNSFSRFLARKYLYFIEDFKNIESLDKYFSDKLKGDRIIIHNQEMTIISPNNYPNVLQSTGDFLSTFIKER